MNRAYLIKLLITACTILILLGCTQEEAPSPLAETPDPAPLPTLRSTEISRINPDTPAPSTNTPLKTPTQTTTLLPTPAVVTTTESKQTATPGPFTQIGWELRNTGEFLLFSYGLDDEYYVFAYHPNDAGQVVSYGYTLPGWPLSPDRTQIVFDYFQEWPLGGPPGQLLIADLITGDTADLNLESTGSEFYWSPDGKYLLYRERTGMLWEARLALYDLDTQDILYVTDVAEILSIAGWSSDGRKIAYVSNINGNFDLYTFELATQEYRQLTDDPAIEYEAHWLPNQDTLLFGTLEEVHIPEISPFGVDNLYLLDTEDTSLTLLGDGYYKSISVDPEGKRIAYAELVRPGSDSPCILDLESNQTNCDLLVERPNEFNHFENMAWSADGTKLAFQAAGPNELCHNVYILDLTTDILTAAGEEGCSAGSLYWSAGIP